MIDIFNLNSYDYHLPPELIANEPVLPRSRARLLVYHKNSGKIEHKTIADLPQILPECAIIFNDTKVIKARIFGHKASGGAVELLINQPLGGDIFSCYIKGRVAVGGELFFDQGLRAQILELKSDGLRVVKFSQNAAPVGAGELFKTLDAIGHIPLPPYIHRPDFESDKSWYQSIFAKNEGAVAAPTASLHFEPHILEDLRAHHQTAFITLHVGAGTFKGVEVSDIRAHNMHGEFFAISDSAKKIIDSAVPLLGVGTTVTRTVEYYARTGLLSGECDLFLHPANPPRRQNYLLTNFHLPKSTLIMLVASFIGIEATRRLYEVAVSERYRFYSYGDAMVVV